MVGGARQKGANGATARAFGCVRTTDADASPNRAASRRRPLPACPQRPSAGGWTVKGGAFGMAGRGEVVASRRAERNSKRNAQSAQPKRVRRGHRGGLCPQQRIQAAGPMLPRPQGWQLAAAGGGTRPGASPSFQMPLLSLLLSPGPRRSRPARRGRRWRTSWLVVVEGCVRRSGEVAGWVYCEKERVRASRFSFLRWCVFLLSLPDN